MLVTRATGEGERKENIIPRSPPRGVNIIPGSVARARAYKNE